MTYFTHRFQRNVLSSAVVMIGGLVTSGAVSANSINIVRDDVNVVLFGSAGILASENLKSWVIDDQGRNIITYDNYFPDPGFYSSSPDAHANNHSYNFAEQIDFEYLIGRIDQSADFKYQVAATNNDLGLSSTGYSGIYTISARNTVELWDGDVVFSGVDSIDTESGSVHISQVVWGFQNSDGIITVDHSGSGIALDVGANFFYVMDASATLSTRDQYYFNGTAVVPSTATLEAVLNDGHAPDQAFYKANQFDIADGATIRVDGSSADYTAPSEDARYVIVEAGTLNANFDALNLVSVGLNDVSFDNLDNQIAITVTPQDLAVLAGQFGDGVNGVAAASGLQSVLELVGGTASGDGYYDLAVALRDSGSFEQLSPMVENTSVASTRGADAQAANHVGGLLQSYRGGASGDAPIASGLWIQGLSSRGEQDSMGDASGFDIDTSGYAVGYDVELVQGLTAGFAISYADSDVEVNNSFDRQNSDGYTGAFYGQYMFDSDYYASAILSYGENDNDSRRWVAGDYAEADFDSDIVSLRLVGGKKIWIDSLLVQPLVELNYSDIGIDSYTEVGSVAALSVDDQDYKVVELGFGASISQDFAVGSTLLRPELKTAYYHDFEQDGVSITSAFTAGGNSFVTTGEDADANRYSVKAGVAWVLGDSNTLRASYDYNRSDNYTGGTWLMDYRMDF